MPQILPALPAIIGAAGSIGSALIGRSGAKQMTGPLTKMAATTGSMGTGALGESLGYFSPLVTGDREAMVSAEGPQISSLAKQYMNARREISEFAPRGGGTASTLAQTPFNLADAITALLQGARTDAAGKVANIGTAATGISAGLTGEAARVGLTQEQISGQTALGLGSALGKIVGLIMNKGNQPSGDFSMEETLANLGLPDTNSAGGTIAVGGPS